MPVSEKPNVLFIINHDVSRDWFGCYGAPIHTPHIDALADSGFVMGRHYCQYPLCGPSRGTIFTGCRPDTTQLYNNVEFYPGFRERVGPGSATLPEHFRNRGYHTQAVNNVMGVTGGKVMDDTRKPAHDTPSWSAPRWEPPSRELPNWLESRGRTSANLNNYALESSFAAIRRRVHVMRMQGKDPLLSSKRCSGPAVEMADVPDNAYQTGVQTDRIVQYLETYASGKREPFFLTAGYNTGHFPWVAPKKYWDLYEPESLILPKTSTVPAGAPDCAPNPAYTPAKGYTQDAYDHPWAPTPEQLLELRHAYFACQSFFDAQIGSMIAALERLGLRERTVVVVTTDHGLNMGEHGQWHKVTNYEPDHGVPLVLSSPGHAGNGRHIDAFTEHVDIYPTLCDLCGLGTPGHLEGTSFAPLLNNPERPWKRAAFGQVFRKPRESGAGFMGYTMRTKRYRFTRWENFDENREIAARELYDYERDPLETVNCADDPEHAGILAELESQMEAGWRGALPMEGE